MTVIVVDVEADGPIPGDYSMVAIGAVAIMDEKIHVDSFYGKLVPISEKFVPEALAVSGFTREETLEFDDPTYIMEKFRYWLKTYGGSRPMFYSDNNGFDWQFVNWYFHHFLGANPFGHSSTNINSLFKGMMKDCWKNHKKLRKTKHTHHPVDDATGNAEALIAMKQKYGLKINLK